LENILIIIDADDTCYDFPEYNSDKRHIRRARRRRGLQYYYCSRKSRFSDRRVGLFQRMLKRVFTKLNIQDESPTMLTLIFSHKWTRRVRRNHYRYRNATRCRRRRRRVSA